MKSAAILSAAIAILFASPAAAQDRIGTIAHGAYVCETPGDAGRTASIARPQLSFTILSASRYSSPQGGGTYLRRDDRVTMTSGPRNGDSYTVERRGLLHKLENGEETRLRCVRRPA